MAIGIGIGIGIPSGALNSNQSDGPVSPFPLANIISQYKFEDNALDTVGLNNGTATDVAYVPGLINKAVDLTAATSRVEVPSAADLSFNNGTTDIPFSFTFCVKFHTAPSSTNKPVFLNKKSTVDGSLAEYQIDHTNTEGFQFQITDPTFSNRLRVYKAFTPTLNQWYHFTITYDGSETLGGMKIYFDGVEQTVSTATSGTYTGMTAGSGDLVMGANAQNSGRTLDGEMDAVRIWNKELSQTEVTDIATAELAGTDINP
tara:strand:+ start:406 stop:1182 length:777 start_codon:yes stop_codon:yes gene_type:complete